MVAPQLPMPAPEPAGRLSTVAGRPLGVRSRTVPERTRTLSDDRLAAIQTVIRMFVEDDLANGMPADRQLQCDACQQARPAPGFIHYNHHLVCNDCAVDYEIARAEGRVLSAAEYVRGRTFAAQGTRLMRLK